MTLFRSSTMALSTETTGHINQAVNSNTLHQEQLTFGLEFGHFGLELVRRSAAFSALELELGVFEEIMRLIGHFQAL